MTGHKFKVGDRVSMVNDYGVEFSGKTVLSLEATTYGPAYKIEPTDSPWFAVPERNLRAAIAGEAQRGETTEIGSTGTASTRAEGIAQ